MPQLQGDGEGGYTYDGLPMPPKLTKTGVDAVWQAWSELTKAFTSTLPALIRRLAYAVTHKAGG